MTLGWNVTAIFQVLDLRYLCFSGRALFGKHFILCNMELEKIRYLSCWCCQLILFLIFKWFNLSATLEDVIGKALQCTGKGVPGNSEKMDRGRQVSLDDRLPFSC